MRVLRRRQRRFRLHQIRGCAALYDADWIGGLADGAAVAAWADRSGNGRDLAQGTGSLQPTYQTGEANGRPVLRFDGTDDLLQGGAFAGSVFFGAQQASVWLVYKNTGATNNQIFVWQPTATNLVEFFGAFGDDNCYFDHGDPLAGGRLSAAQPAGWDNAYHIVECRRSGTAGQVLVDGTAVVSGTFSDDFDPSAASALVVGNLSTIDLALCTIYSRDLTARERNRIKRALHRRSGVAVV